MLNSFVGAITRRALLAAFVLMLVAGVRSGFAAEVAREYQLKAVLLFRLTQFVQWPAEAFAETNSPVVIGIIGQNPFGPAVEIASRDETAHGRPILVRYYAPAADISDCHVLYVAQSEMTRAPSLLRRVENKPVLTVSDMEGFAADMGGMVRFRMAQNKIGLLINLDSAKAAGLSIDARLLRMAEVVKK